LHPSGYLQERQLTGQYKLTGAENKRNLCILGFISLPQQLDCTLNFQCLSLKLWFLVTTKRNSPGTEAWLNQWQDSLFSTEHPLGSLEDAPGQPSPPSCGPGMLTTMHKAPKPAESTNPASPATRAQFLCPVLGI